MMKITHFIRSILILTPLFFFAISCSDFFEEDIERKEVLIFAPKDGYSSPTQSVTFWWEELEGSTHYEVQIVSNSFQNTQRIWADTIMDVNKLVLVLQPGTYQWRIRGFNSAYSTAFVVLSFSVEYNTDLTEQELVLKEPENNYFTNKSQINFSWFALSAADSYVFELKTISGDAIVAPYETGLTSVVFPDDFDIEYIQDGEYRWSVFAKNSYSMSPVSSRLFVLDRVNPAIPVQITPANKDTLSIGNITFTWDRPAESLAPIFDSLFVQTLNDSIIVSKRLSTASSTINLNAGEFKWRIQSFDLAGNESEPSGFWNLTVE